MSNLLTDNLNEHASYPLDARTRLSGNQSFYDLHGRAMRKVDVHLATAHGDRAVELRLLRLILDERRAKAWGRHDGMLANYVEQVLVEYAGLEGEVL